MEQDASGRKAASTQTSLPHGGHPSGSATVYWADAEEVAPSGSGAGPPPSPPALPAPNTTCRLPPSAAPAEPSARGASRRRPGSTATTSLTRGVHRGSGAKRCRSGRPKDPKLPGGVFKPEVRMTIMELWVSFVNCKTSKSGSSLQLSLANAASWISVHSQLQEEWGRINQLAVKRILESIKAHMDKGDNADGHGRGRACGGTREQGRGPGRDLENAL
ncbi:hypothetical protein I4F81_005028 [Pyropia yezoensis]|uniref:Uncharacterized protein n=1 Tax=Pyropia yezoensis TaxID=2788 RepID=A0ACC3BWP2_PYRYE|nr:hypothetical protein I4F81_005028 [Neopyropia yezoensis]